jgi:hypothetical protein
MEVDLDVDVRIILKWTLKDSVGGEAVESIRLALNILCDNGHGSRGRGEHDNLFTACRTKI